MVAGCSSQLNNGHSVSTNKEKHMSDSLLGKTFADDWKNFKSKDFSLRIEVAQSQMWDKTTYGQLTFKNKKDKSILLIYHAFLIEETDSVFYKNIQDWYFKQSCSSIGEMFRPFNHNKYYYYLEPCDRCGTAFNKDCAELLNQIKQFVTGYPK